MGSSECHSEKETIADLVTCLEHNGPVKLIQYVKIAHSVSVCVKSVPLYRFKLAYVVLHMTAKEFFETLL